ncbi:hypothetical protein BDY21DRAFT_362036 [Lineolata rhizophorae]|uniref:Uncharacterized protein n=1 Tax=Lineolata rhizophorae TaxID=578093 RepID=A0A6A6P606_9PEZI|nr:hypothetical protein BDY21DRAFT_362036 [Lineolata rhizophorae]
MKASSRYSRSFVGPAQARLVEYTIARTKLAALKDGDIAQFIQLIFANQDSLSCDTFENDLELGIPGNNAETRSNTLFSNPSDSANSASQTDYSLLVEDAARPWHELAKSELAKKTRGTRRNPTTIPPSPATRATPRERNRQCKSGDEAVGQNLAKMYGNSSEYYSVDAPQPQNRLDYLDNPPQAVL